MTDYTEQAEKCEVCQSEENVAHRPMMTGNTERLVCTKCYIAWYATGITNPAELLKYRKQKVSHE